METSSKLSLPYIMPSQAQKHVTHNKAIRMLDGLVQLAAKSIAAVAPPETPTEGDIYFLGENCIGAWANQDGKAAHYIDGAWQFYTPKDGWIFWNEDTLQVYVYVDNGLMSLVDITAASLSALQNLNLLGINATADTTNRLSVSSPATLLNHAGDGHQLSINKSATDKTASVVFQSDFFGKAEMGLAGNDKFAVKVSSDSNIWHNALEVEPASGAVDFPNGALVSGVPISAGAKYSAGMSLQGYSTSSTTMVDISDPDEIISSANDTSLLITMIFSGVVRSSNGGKDALAWIKPAYVQNAVVYETFRNHLIGALNTQGATSGSTNSFYLTSPATFIMTPQMKDGDRWKPMFKGKCHAGDMVLQGFGFSWTAMEIRQ